MKEYKIIKRGFWKKDSDLEELINQEAKVGWEVKSVIGNTDGSIIRVVLERNKNR